jgi:hypothetical protein
MDSFQVLQNEVLQSIGVEAYIDPKKAFIDKCKMVEDQEISFAYNRINAISREELLKNFSKYNYLINILGSSKSKSTVHTCDNLVNLSSRFRMRFKAWERIIFENSGSTLNYLKIFKESKIPDGEMIISEDCNSSYDYAIHSNTRFTLGEPSIFLDKILALKYCCHFNFRKEDLEDYLFEPLVNPNRYDKTLMRGVDRYVVQFNIPDNVNLRNLFSIYGECAIEYTKKILYGERFLEFEEKIKKDMDNFNNSLLTINVLDFDSDMPFSYISSLKDPISFEEGYKFAILNSSVPNLLEFFVTRNIRNAEFEDRLVEFGRSSCILKYLKVLPKKERIKGFEDILKQDSTMMLQYCVYHLEERCLEAEENFFSICSVYEAWHYVRDVIKGECLTAEKVLCTKSDVAVEYAILTKKRFVEAEYSIFGRNTNLEIVTKYLKHLSDISSDNKIKRIAKAEKFLAKSFQLSMDYSRYTNRRIKKIEDDLMYSFSHMIRSHQNLCQTIPSEITRSQETLNEFINNRILNYAKNVFFGKPWPELERLYPDIVNNETYKGILNNGSSRPKRQRRKPSGVDLRKESERFEEGEQAST